MTSKALSLVGGRTPAKPSPVPGTGRVQLALSAHEVRAIAVAAFANPKTVERFLAGEPVRSTSAGRIKKAMAELGIALP